MRKARPHRITAAFFDLMVIGSLLQAAAMLLAAMLGLQVTDSFILILCGIWLLPLILYHLVLSRRLVACTPGETIAGCVVVDGRKRWVSRFDRSRKLLFVTLFLILLYPVNAFDSMLEGIVWPVSRVIGTVFQVLVFVVAVVMMAWGRLGWSVPVLVLLLIGFLSAAGRSTRAADPTDQMAQEVYAGMAAMVMGLLVICLLVYWRSRTDRAVRPATEADSGRHRDIDLA